MHDEIVQRRKWISESRFLHALSFAFILPGPEAQQLATYIGWRLHGLRGAIAAGGLFVLPSFVLLCILSFIYVRFGHVAAVAGVVRGLGGAVVGLVLAAVVRIGGRVARSGLAMLVASIAFTTILLGVPFPVILLAAAVGAVVLQKHRPGSFPGMGHGDEDDVTTDSESVGSRRGWIVIPIWLVFVGALVAVGGVVGDLAGFFSISALITFGGAYAVLPFVADHAVNHFGWLTHHDMITGLALGESTPGPLIMVNAFVGYMAGWTSHTSYWWALGGATVATLATFVPSFVFILVGGPFVDRLPRSGRIASALHGVSVAVVGVIAALAVFVGRHVLVVDGSIDWLAIALAAAALVGLARFRINVVWIIAASALAGLLASL